MTDITVIILTYNEEMHIKRCIQSVRGIASKVFVVDSFSDDHTIDIAESEGAIVYQHKFVNQAKQFQWALDTIPIESGWIMRLDADEYPVPELVDEIKLRLSTIDNDISGINLKRRHIFMGRWIKHGTRYPLVLLRIWRTGQAYVEQRWMDEHILLKSGRAINFENDFCDHNLHDVSWWSEKHIKYAAREAIEVLKRKYIHIVHKESTTTGAGDRFSQARFKRIIKERIYNFLPMFTGPILYFLYRYFLRLGFLDGKEGAIYHFLQGFWYRFLVEVKVFEVESRMVRDNVDCEEAIRREFSVEKLV